MDDLQVWSNVLVAVAVAHAVHSLMEPVNIRAKVKRLNKYINGDVVKEIPVSIDTRSKAYLVGASILLLIFGFALLVVDFIDPEPVTNIIVAVGILVAIEIINTVVIDLYHMDIEEVTKRFMHKSEQAKKPAESNPKSPSKKSSTKAKK